MKNNLPVKKSFFTYLLWVCFLNVLFLQIFACAIKEKHTFYRSTEAFFCCFQQNHLFLDSYSHLFLLFWLFTKLFLQDFFLLWNLMQVKSSRPLKRNVLSSYMNKNICMVDTNLPFLRCCTLTHIHWIWTPWEEEKCQVQPISQHTHTVCDVGLGLSH